MSSQRKSVISSWRRGKQSEGDNLLHRYGGGAVITDAPEMIHQSIELFKRGAAISLSRHGLFPIYVPAEVEFNFSPGS